MYVGSLNSFGSMVVWLTRGLPLMSQGGSLTSSKSKRDTFLFSRFMVLFAMPPFFIGPSLGGRPSTRGGYAHWAHP